MKIGILATAILSAALTACGGGGGGTDAPAKPAETCKTVTDISGDMIDKNGKVILAGKSNSYSLCCSTAFKVTTTPDVTAADGSVTKGNTVNSCS